MRLLLLLAMLPMAVSAQDLRILSGGAAKSLVEPMAASFPGGKVDVQFQPMGKLFESLAQGLAFDFHDAAKVGADLRILARKRSVTSLR